MYTKKIYFLVGILNIKKPYFLLGVKLKSMKIFIIIFTQIISFPFSTLLFFSTILYNLNYILTYISSFLLRLLQNLARLLNKKKTCTSSNHLMKPPVDAYPASLASFDRMVSSFSCKFLM